ncbi:thiolase family protein [Mycolicibacterium porcinum]|uniref:Thiolase family protein n=1 Tax=Mycolicibacterium porcinum TaxID=39693 RepID=A0AAW5T0P8_9MYCO|nr:thiolase family protein [Mycolicibacterium porcinum]MCV7388113.1 thiolase family protein [Mycolicibacterium porcinum]ORB43755.1 acetyl-CoA acetyltransferase [Mycolicibacterium porcinum]
MESAVIIDAVRTPMGRGKPGGSLAEINAVDLLAQTLSALMARNDVDPAAVDDVVTGCVSQAGEQAGTPGRFAWLAAGLPEHVPGVTIDRRCGSGQQAVDYAAWAIMAGAQDIVVACGVESMSRVPMGVARMGVDPFAPAAHRYPPGLVPQGISAELIAAKWRLSREDQDRYAVESHHRAAAAATAGAFDNEIVAVKDGDRVVKTDETIRPDTSEAKLAGLKPAFYDDGYAQRFPDIAWTVTAGNSSQITDGAAALLITSESTANRLGLTPLARLLSFATAAEDPVTMLAAPIPAARKALQRAGLAIDDIARYEVNEAFATVPLAWQQELDADPDKLNPVGGAIALGHPLGASGARIMTTLVHGLRPGEYGLQTMCENGGMANATILQRL